MKIMWSTQTWSYFSHLLHKKIYLLWLCMCVCMCARAYACVCVRERFKSSQSSMSWIFQHIRKDDKLSLSKTHPSCLTLSDHRQKNWIYLKVKEECAYVCVVSPNTTHTHTLTDRQTHTNTHVFKWTSHDLMCVSLTDVSYDAVRRSGWTQPVSAAKGWTDVHVLLALRHFKRQCLTWLCLFISFSEFCCHPDQSWRAESSVRWEDHG